MGLINTIFIPERWSILKKGVATQDKTTIIYLVKIGHWDDSITMGSITEFFSKNVYEKIQNKEYNIKNFPYHEHPVKVYNQEGQEIDLIQYENSPECERG